MSSFTNVILYFIGLVVFGFLYWLMDGILDIMKGTGVQNTTDFTPWELLIYVWAGIVIVYLVFGGIWLVRSFQRDSMTAEFGGSTPIFKQSYSGPSRSEIRRMIKKNK